MFGTVSVQTTGQEDEQLEVTNRSNTKKSLKTQLRHCFLYTEKLTKAAQKYFLLVVKL